MLTVIFSPCVCSLETVTYVLSFDFSYNRHYKNKTTEKQQNMTNPPTQWAHNEGGDIRLGGRPQRPLLASQVVPCSGSRRQAVKLVGSRPLSLRSATSATFAIAITAGLSLPSTTTTHHFSHHSPPFGAPRRWFLPPIACRLVLLSNIT